MVIGSQTSFKNNPIQRQGENCTRIRITEERDAYGVLIGTTESSSTVKVVFGNISRKDQEIADIGKATTGEMKVYFSMDQELLNGDYLIDQRNIKWRVESIDALYNEVYGIASVKNFGLNAS